MLDVFLSLASSRAPTLTISTITTPLATLFVAIITVSFRTTSIKLTLAAAALTL
jgi:hypothetical protein